MQPAQQVGIVAGAGIVAEMRHGGPRLSPRAGRGLDRDLAPVGAELVGALAYLTIPALVGPVVGPPLGGFITTYLHWRLIFFINVRSEGAHV